MDEVEVLDVNPCFVRVKYPSGHEDNVSLRHIAPAPPIEIVEQSCDNHVISDDIPSVANKSLNSSPCTPNNYIQPNATDISINNVNTSNHTEFSSDDDEEFIGFRRSARIREKPQVNYRE